jgi:hypothetical protein
MQEPADKTVARSINNNNNMAKLHHCSLPNHTLFTVLLAVFNPSTWLEVNSVHVTSLPNLLPTPPTVGQANRLAQRATSLKINPPNPALH